MSYVMSTDGGSRIQGAQSAHTTIGGHGRRLVHSSVLKEGGGDTGNPRTGSGALTQVGKKGCGGGVQAPSERNVTAVCTSVTMTHRGR